MLKANSKEVKKAIEAYILDCLEGKTTAEKVKNAYASFSYYYKQGDNIQDSFINFLRGLPFFLDYTTYKERELLKSWLKESEAEADRYSWEQVDKKYYYLIFCGFKRLFDKNNINLSNVME